MSIRRLPIILFLAIIIVVAISIPTKPQIKIQALGTLFAGGNVNMVAGTGLNGYGDPYLQRQNEPSIAVSTVNPKHLLAGANDYRTVDMPITDEELPGLPSISIQARTAPDAWLGVYRSYDGGKSWKSKLLDGYYDSDDSPLRGYQAASDPTVRAGENGYFYFSGIAFDRIKNGKSVIFVARFQDTNNPSNPDPIIYMDTKIIDVGTSGQFADKPWLAVDKNGNVYIVYSMFLGDLSKGVHNKILLARSPDKGDTWQKPTKLSESHHVNQGTTIAVDHGNGDIYVAWRRFASGNDGHAILLAKSKNFGRSFTKPIEVATITEQDRFDQWTSGTSEGYHQFRTNAFPTMAVDNNHRVYVAWSQRGIDTGDYYNDARIVLKVLGSDENWYGPFAVEAPSALEKPYRKNGAVKLHGHQFMPALAFGAGKLMIAWYDSRYSARYFDLSGDLREGRPSFGAYIRDDISQANPSWNYRETVDVRVAQTHPGNSPSFGSSTQVSRYMWAINDNTKKLRQYQFNPPNYPLFKKGEAPFFSDYIDISPDLSGDSSDFYVSWTDNRDVRPPSDYNWTNYKPPIRLNSSSDCIPDKVGMRNQNIYVSRITSGIEVGSPNDTKSNKIGTESAQRSFAIYVINKTNSPRNFTLAIPSDQAYAGFKPDRSVHEISLIIPKYSSISRQVFAFSTVPRSITVNVSGGGFSEDVELYLVEAEDSEGENTTINIAWEPEEPRDWGAIDFQNPNIVNPNIVNDSVVNPNIVNPNIVNPNIVNPNIVNPNIVNPNIVNPNIVNPNIVNPNIVNPNIVLEFPQ